MALFKMVLKKQCYRNRNCKNIALVRLATGWTSRGPTRDASFGQQRDGQAAGRHVMSCPSGHGTDERHVQVRGFFILWSNGRERYFYNYSCESVIFANTTSNSKARPTARHSIVVRLDQHDLTTNNARPDTARSVTQNCLLPFVIKSGVASFASNPLSASPPAPPYVGGRSNAVSPFGSLPTQI